MALYLYVRVCVLVSVCRMCAGSCLVWVLGTEPRYSARVGNTPNWAVYHTLKILFYLLRGAHCVALADLELDIASLKLNRDPHFLSAGYFYFRVFLCLSVCALSIWACGDQEGLIEPLEQSFSTCGSRPLRGQMTLSWELPKMTGKHRYLC